MATTVFPVLCALSQPLVSWRIRVYFLFSLYLGVFSQMSQKLKCDRNGACDFWGQIMKGHMDSTCLSICLSVCLSFRISASGALSTTQLGHARKAIWRHHQCLRAPSCQGAPSPGTTHVSEEAFEVTPPNRDCLTAILWNATSQKFPAEPLLNSWPEKLSPSLFYHYVLGDFYHPRVDNEHKADVHTLG